MQTLPRCHVLSLFRTGGRLPGHHLPWCHFPSLRPHPLASTAVRPDPSQGLALFCPLGVAWLPPPSQRHLLFLQRPPTGTLPSESLWNPVVMITFEWLLGGFDASRGLSPGNLVSKTQQSTAGEKRGATQHHRKDNGFNAARWVRMPDDVTSQECPFPHLKRGTFDIDPGCPEVVLRIERLSQIANTFQMAVLGPKG